jgi:hypothetical protein
MGHLLDHPGGIDSCNWIKLRPQPPEYSMSPMAFDPLPRVRRGGRRAPLPPAAHGEASCRKNPDNDGLERDR